MKEKNLHIIILQPGDRQRWINAGDGKRLVGAGDRQQRVGAKDGQRRVGGGDGQLGNAKNRLIGEKMYSS